MLKTVIWIAIGIAAGVVATVSLRPSPRLAEIDSSTTDRDYEQLMGRISELEALVGDLATKMEGSGSDLRTTANAGPQRGSAVSLVGVNELRALADRVSIAQVAGSREPQGSDRVIEQLVAGGFSQGRAEQISRRSDELTMELIELRYEAERGGTPLSPEILASLDLRTVLREELGDRDYERYLSAVGGDTNVSVLDVFDNSPAAQAGLQSGDRIVSYGGNRVFDFREVTPLTIQGTPGESVIVDILRDGQPMQIVVPRGPLGVRLYSQGSIVGVGTAQP